MNSEIRIEALIWSGETWDVMEGVAGFSNSTVSTNSFSAIGIDSTTTPEPNGVLLTLLGTGVGGMSVGASARSIKTGLSEGYHWATVIGKTDGGAASWSSSGDGNRTALSARAQRV
ncbi:hypothetical protein [Bradyrhizobium sp. CCBAU 53380]|uniref:hypothetical protein n=1 Tax=Bradyrhizobium sp. CCBAU 53380 TaxID=1325117 RepID=UPI002304A63A|nr:hypothetical protein [Bradyrhizobium sp. CCBAU 53380]